MQFAVVGVDHDDVESDDALDEAHQAYMDLWAAELVARGPTEVRHGHGHTGSIHVITLPSRSAAERFAEEEPYHRAGLYRQVTVTPVRPCLVGTMWDRPPVSPGLPASVVVAAFDAPGVDAMTLTGAVRRHLEGAPWIYVGVLDDPEPSGLLAMVDEDVDHAGQLAADLLRAVDVAGARIRTQPWRRGGR